MAVRVSQQSKNQAHSYMLDTVRISNAILDAVWSLDVVQQRILWSAIAKIPSFEKVDSSCFYRVTIDDLMDMGTPRSKCYLELRKATETFFQRYISIALDGDKRLKLHWMQAVVYVDGESAIDLQFTSLLLPALSNLKANYTSFPLADLRGINSSYAMRLYPMLLRWLDPGKKSAVWTVSLDTLREQLDAKDVCTAWSDFRVRILDTAMRQINSGARTMIKFRYEEIKTGRKVTGLKIFITRKPRKALAAPEVLDPATKTYYSLELTDKQLSFAADLLAGSDNSALLRAKLSPVALTNELYQAGIVRHGALTGMTKTEVHNRLLRSLQDTAILAKAQPLLSRLGFNFRSVRRATKKTVMVAVSTGKDDAGAATPTSQDNAAVIPLAKDADYTVSDPDKCRKIAVWLWNNVGLNSLLQKLQLANHMTTDEVNNYSVYDDLIFIDRLAPRLLSNRPIANFIYACWGHSSNEW